MCVVTLTHLKKKLETEADGNKALALKQQCFTTSVSTYIKMKSYKQ